MADLGGQKAKKRGDKRKLSAIYSVICQLFINFVRIFHPAMRRVAPRTLLQGSEKRAGKEPKADGVEREREKK